MTANDFWQGLNDSYYETFPELWEEDPLYVDGPKFVAILNEETSVFNRRLTSDEEVTENALIRAGRKIWEVGRVYHVRAEPWKEPTLGQIKLISIQQVNEGWAKLYFEPSGACQMKSLSSPEPSLKPKDEWKHLPLLDRCLAIRGAYHEVTTRWYGSGWLASSRLLNAQWGVLFNRFLSQVRR